MPYFSLKISFSTLSLSESKKFLFICSMTQLRSLTAERMYQGFPRLRSQISRYISGQVQAVISFISMAQRSFLGVAPFFFVATAPAGHNTRHGLVIAPFPAHR